MGGFAAAIGGMGDTLNTRNRDLLQQHFQHNENQQALLHARAKNIMDSYEKLAEQYPDSPRMRDAITNAQITLNGVGLNDQSLARVSQELQKARQDILKEQAVVQAQRQQEAGRTPAVREALSQAQAPPALGVPPVAMPNAQQSPLSGIISGSNTGFTGAGPVSANPPGAQLIAQSQGAAQAPTSPIDGRLPQGGGRPAAPFPANTPAPSAPAPIPQVPGAAELANGPQPNSNAPILPPVAQSTEVASPPGSNPYLGQQIEQDYNDYQRTGFMTPLLKTTFGLQAQTEQQLEEKRRGGGVELSNRQDVLRAVEPYLKNLPEVMRGTYPAAILSGTQPTNVSALMAPKIVSVATQGKHLTPGTRILAANGQEVQVDPESFYRVEVIPFSGDLIAYPTNGPTAMVTTSEGGTKIIPRVAGADPVGVNPAMLSTVSQQSSPGEPTITNTRSKVPPPSIPPVNGAAPPPTGQVRVPAAPKQGAVSPYAGYEKDIMEGRTTLEQIGDARLRAAIRKDMQDRNLPVPVALSAKGQSDLSQIDPILDEVKRMKQLVAERKGKLSKPGLAADYAKYMYLKIPTENDDLISGLSFADLRSAAQALKGSGSRAERILNRALEHTPSVGLNFSDPGQIENLLAEMEKRLVEGRDAILRDEKKSGVIGPVPGAPYAGPPPKTAAEYLQTVQ